MKCPTCDNDNPADAQFCGGCGTSLSVSKGSGIETASSGTPRTTCPACGNDIESNKPFCLHCGKELSPAQNPSGGSAGRTIGGVLIGLVVGLLYGLIPGAVIVNLLAYLTIGFLPGFAYYITTFGGIGYIFISIFVGLVIFPIVGGIYGSKGWNPLKKKRLVITALLVHSVLAYGIFVAIDNPPPPTPTSTPYPTPEGLNYYKQGEQYLNDENYVKSIESFTEYINLNPNDARGYDRRGGSYQELKRYQKAIKDYDKAIELDPDPENIWPYHYKGMAYRELEQYELAIQNWERYVELRLIESDDWIESEQAADAYTNIGLAYIELGQYQKAIEHFDKVLKIDPNYSSAIHGKEKATESLK